MPAAVSTVPANSPPAPGAPSPADATPDVASSSTAAALLSALRTVVKRLERTPIPVDRSAEAAWTQSHSTESKAHSAESKSQPAPRHVAALMQVVADEGMSVSTLATRLGVSLATASQVVTDLEASSLVERVDDPGDRRRTLVRVAESHRALADALLDTRLRPVQRALDQLRPAEQRVVIRGLTLIAAELERPTGV